MTSVTVPEEGDNEADEEELAAGILFNKFKQAKKDNVASECHPTSSNTVVREAEIVSGEQKATASGGPGGHAVRVSWRQKGNKVLTFVRNVAWQFDDVRVDYDVGSGCGILYLSLKFNKRYPDYIYDRIKEVGNRYILKVLLLLMDSDASDASLREINRTCVQSKWTLIIAESVEEVAEYIEAYKIYEHKPADALRAPAPINSRKDGSGVSGGQIEWEQAVALLTCVRSVNKSDAARLIDMFGSIRKITNASVEQLSLCPGMGPAKAKRLYDALREKFV